MFGEKNGVFSKTNVVIKFWHILHSCVLSKKMPFFAKLFGGNFQKIKTATPVSSF
jgi:hypothetical protein